MSIKEIIETRLAEVKITHKKSIEFAAKSLERGEMKMARDWLKHELISRYIIETLQEILKKSEKLEE